ncbi:hypothetical protein [Methylorubrum podarium]|jgi:hypothetical protein|uniref:hypothetical protein n=1 Tax=Methylorubrum podarium TaxID=200476 RepID=UPI001EE2E359|nr:hypothetical protein [Methylorubrum podarium]GJE70012.1 hypothetical protein CHKEEEPN_1545 [Methylorubrum podarium]
MADIWASYSEVGQLCACSADEARGLIRMRGWPRRRCSDGVTRTKLPADLAQAFIQSAALRLDLDRLADLNVARLRAVTAQPDLGLPVQQRLA